MRTLSICVSLGLSLSLMAACGKSSSFNGSAKQTTLPQSENAIPEPVVAPVVESTPIPDPPADIPPRAEAPVIIAPIDPIQIPMVCREKLDYNPSQILCSLPVDGSQKTAWGTGMWTTSWMVNQKSQWINPLEPVVSGEKAYCPYVPGGEKVVYVANFTLATEEEVLIESIIDDIGQVRLWKNADPKQEVFISERSHKSSDKIKLAAGFYTIVIDGVDSGKLASAAASSVIDSKGVVIRQTESSAEWCIFRLTVEQDIAEFLLSASACKSCMIGASANK